MGTPNRPWESEQHRDGFELARSTTATYARSFYWSAQLLPRDIRWATYGLYGFCRHADNLVDEADGLTDQDIRDRISDLRRRLDDAHGSGASDHPILDAFVQVVHGYDIPIDHAHALLDGVSMDIGGCRYGSLAELDIYCHRVAGVVGLMMTHVLGYENSAAFEHADRLGKAMQLTNILRDIDEDRQLDRIYLPKDAMSRFGVVEEDIMEGRMSPELAALIASIADIARAGYASAEPGIDMLHQRSRFAIRSASRIYRGILDRIQARGNDPFQGRVYVSGRSKAGIVLVEAIRSRFARKMPIGSTGAQEA